MMDNKFYVQFKILLLLGFALLMLGCRSSEVDSAIQVAEIETRAPATEDNEIVILVPTGTSTATVTVTPTLTATLISTPIEQSATPTLEPTRTPSATLARTATPGIMPSGTPAANFSPMSWATQELPGACPVRQHVKLPEFVDPSYDFEQTIAEIMNYLNQGGSITRLKLQPDLHIDTVDVTNDAIPDVILRGPVAVIFSCVEGEFVELFRAYPESGGYSPLNLRIRDLNRNGVRDLTVATEFWGAHNYTLVVRVFEWDGEGFVNMMAEEIDHPYRDIGRLYGGTREALMFNGSLRLEDVDENGTVELLLHGGIEGGFSGQRSAPQLSETHTWMWNGSEYTFVDVTFSEPWIKYQAVVAADLYSRMGQFEEAFELYHRAIYDQELTAWNAAWNEPLGGGYEVYPTRQPEDLEQAERIHAYARYRIMVTRYVAGDVTGAHLQYNTNLAIHQQDNPGYHYAKLSEVFHQMYRKSQSIEQGCAAVQQYAMEHPQEVLWPLGIGIYGEANPGYKPQDLCPFTE